MLAARRGLYQFFDTPKWLWNPGMPSDDDSVVVRVPGEGRSIVLSVEPMTGHDCTVAKMIELGGNEFRMKALKAFKEYLPAMKKPVPESDEPIWDKASILAVPIAP